MRTDMFIERHLGPNEEEIKKMLDKIGVNSISQLLEETIPEGIRLKNPLQLPEGISEYEFAKHINLLGGKNKVFETFIGLGYHPSIVPAVIQRNILENPGWYTACLLYTSPSPRD